MRFGTWGNEWGITSVSFQVAPGMFGNPCDADPLKRGLPYLINTVQFIFFPKVFVKTWQRIDSTSLGRTKSYNNIGYIYTCFLAILQSPMAFYTPVLFDLPIFIIWILCVYRLSVTNDEMVVTESINMEVAISTAHICKAWIFWISFNILSDKHYVEDVVHRFEHLTWISYYKHNHRHLANVRQKSSLYHGLLNDRNL